VGKPDVKRLLWRRRFRLEDNINMDLKGIWYEGVDWIHLAQDREKWLALMNTVMNFRVV
jgi:hypothetical protein